MDRNEFISILRAALQGEVSDAVVEENVEYYYQYISDEIARGKRESEVMEMLGDPRLIARTIIDTAGGTGSSGYSRTYTEHTSENDRKGFRAEENAQGGVDIHYGRLKLNSWYGKLLILILVVLVLALIFTVVGGILSVVLPVLLPVLVILLVIRIFTDRR